MVWIVDTAWLCTSFTGELRPQESEVSELKWFDVHALPPREEWAPHIYRQMQDALRLLEKKGLI